MSKDLAVEVKGLSKRYRIGEAEMRHETFGEQLLAWVLYPIRNFNRILRLSKFKEGEEKNVHWAIRELSFEIPRGQVLGIIGHNGAGKSTLLKVLSKITSPSEGSARIFGRVSSLLEVGTGFHPELTGRDNIYLNGTILGMTKKEIDSKLNEIISFSGVEKYIDTPVKFYSSGMRVRLAFAVAAHLEPEILIIDEVLAVGDAEFQKKAIGKMEDISTNQKRTILFVSHNMNAIRSLCSRAILLDQGRMVCDSTPDKTIEYYLNQNKKLEQVTSENTSGEIYNVKCKVYSVSGDHILKDSPFNLEFSFDNKIQGSNLGLTFELINESNQLLIHQGHVLSSSKDSSEGTYSAKVRIPGRLFNPGVYFLNVMIGENQRHRVFSKEKIQSFEIVDIGKKSYHNLKNPAIINPELDWEIDFR